MIVNDGGAVVSDNGAQNWLFPTGLSTLGLVNTAVLPRQGHEPGLVIHSVYNGYWFWGRPSVVDLWHDLRAVSREIRPDWDLSRPGLREAWDAGDRKPFHGFD